MLEFTGYFGLFGIAFNVGIGLNFLIIMVIYMEFEKVVIFQGFLRV